MVHGMNWFVMATFVFALLDLRRFILLAVLAGSVPIIGAYGPLELQAPTNRFIVRPLVRCGTELSHQLNRGVAVVDDIGWRDH